MDERYCYVHICMGVASSVLTIVAASLSFERSFMDLLHIRFGVFFCDQNCISNRPPVFSLWLLKAIMVV